MSKSAPSLKIFPIVDVGPRCVSKFSSRRVVLFEKQIRFVISYMGNVSPFTKIFLEIS